MNKRVIAVGFFDGVHKGHQALFNKVLEVAEQKKCTSAVFSFKQHPDTVLLGENIPLLCSFDNHENELLTLGGVKEAFLWEFNQKNASMPWDDFVIDILVGELNACHIITGEDFKFGHKGIGDSEKLAKLCKKLNIGYDAISPVCANNIRISSTYIRKLIEKGDIKQANELLGHSYSVLGEVEHGRKIGRTIGIRTINLSLPKDMQKPANGVYISRVIIDDEKYQAVTNVGTVPTFLNDDSIVIEAHILDFNKDVYGKIAKIEFLEFLRFEQKFSSIDELKAMILQNIEQTREFFKENIL